jgi:hypothetical protein
MGKHSIEMRLEGSCFFMGHGTIISQVENNPTRSTRNNPVQENDLFVKKVRLAQSVQNPLRIYNKLPEALKSEVNDKSFVRRLKKILNDNDFYDIHEFMQHNFD